MTTASPMARKQTRSPAPNNGQSGSAAHNHGYTDGDGYWDGWVGVYNVSYSRNVILYPENLTDGDGIEAGERVDEQVGTHRIAEAPTPTGRYAVIDDEKRHSNLHLGELHWETNPADDGDAAYELTGFK
ncbi:hypothetical protein BRD11_00190 [Halobacteriales archaeon SW_12_69_24]|nr:MAG: hypothetical protein BRD11_00190 [Halobacteriales archaeon SW_12_69_24]